MTMCFVTFDTDFRSFKKNVDQKTYTVPKQILNFIIIIIMNIYLKMYFNCENGTVSKYTKIKNSVNTYSAFKIKISKFL